MVSLLPETPGFCLVRSISMLCKSKISSLLWCSLRDDWLIGSFGWATFRTVCSMEYTSILSTVWFATTHTYIELREVGFFLVLKPLYRSCLVSPEGQSK